MTPDAARAATLVRALHASIEHDRGAAGDLYTEDMRAWTPAMSTASLSELMDEFERRDDAFSEIELEVYRSTLAASTRAWSGVSA